MGEESRPKTALSLVPCSNEKVSMLCVIKWNLKGRCFDAEVLEISETRSLVFDINSSYREKPSLEEWSRLTPG